MPSRLGPRFVIEAGFLLLVAVAVGLAKLEAKWIVAVMGGAWVIVALVEWAAMRPGLWRMPVRRPRPQMEAAPAAPPELAPEAPPMPAEPVLAQPVEASAAPVEVAPAPPPVEPAPPPPSAPEPAALPFEAVPAEPERPAAEEAATTRTQRRTKYALEPLKPRPKTGFLAKFKRAEPDRASEPPAPRRAPAPAQAAPTQAAPSPTETKPEPLTKPVEPAQPEPQLEIGLFERLRRVRPEPPPAPAKTEGKAAAPPPPPPSPTVEAKPSPPKAGLLARLLRPQTGGQPAPPKAKPAPPAAGPPAPVKAAAPQPPRVKEKPVSLRKPVTVQAAPPLPPPAPAPQPAAQVRRLPQPPGSWNLWELERLVRQQGRENPERREEQELVLLHLRDFADPRGSIPANFDVIVRETFGELIGSRGS